MSIIPRLSYIICRDTLGVSLQIDKYRLTAFGNLAFRGYFGFILLDVGDEVGTGGYVVAEAEHVPYIAERHSLGFLHQCKLLEIAVGEFEFAKLGNRFEKAAEH